MNNQQDVASKLRELADEIEEGQWAECSIDYAEDYKTLGVNSAAYRPAATCTITLRRNGV